MQQACWAPKRERHRPVLYHQPVSNLQNLQGETPCRKPASLSILRQIAKEFRTVSNIRPMTLQSISSPHGSARSPRDWRGPSAVVGGPELWPSANASRAGAGRRGFLSFTAIHHVARCKALRASSRLIVEGHRPSVRAVARKLDPSSFMLGECGLAM